MRSTPIILVPCILFNCGAQVLGFSCFTGNERLSSVNVFSTQKSHSNNFIPRHVISAKPSGTALQMSQFEAEILLPPREKGLLAQLKCESVMDVPSELIEVRYPLPFGLDVEPQGGLAVCTKAGTGGEKPGDVLRYTTMWTMGLPRGDGLVTTAASFAGGLQWQCSLLDVMKASRWEEVVEALTSNTQSRTDEVVLLFERALPSTD